MIQQKPPVVTVDGPSGSGKGSVVRVLAQQLGWHVLDSGALYRLTGLAAERRCVDFENVEHLVKVSKTLNIQFVSDHNKTKVMLDGDDVTTVIRTEAVGALASRVAKIPEVREALLQRQRDFSTFPGLLADGRDMGTEVFPDASLKVYLTASVEARADRRFKQLKSLDEHPDVSHVEDQIRARDKQDMERLVSPLRPADDAVMIDSTTLTIEEVCRQILELVKARGLG